MSSQVSDIPIGSVQYDDVKRNTRDFPPDLWGYYFLNVASDDEIIEEKIKQEWEELKEEVRNMIRSSDSEDSLLKKLCLIDDVQRLGVGYHFESEIQDILGKLYNNGLVCSSDENDFHFVSLGFRLLRQEGYPVPSDVFKNFVDNEDKFNESLISDVVGMLSLYEASYLGIQEEQILDDAQAFTTTHLKSMVQDHELGEQILHALKRPIRRNLPRLEAVYCINLYSGDDSKNQNLVKFAKIDFNILQVEYKKELHSLTKWWKSKDIRTNFPYARDRLVESYFWNLGTFEPQYAFARRIITILTAMIAVIDDTFDAYGIYEELQLFTDDFQRWNINNIDHLPKNLKLIYQILYEVMEEAREHITKEGRSDCFDYVINEWKRVIRAYCLEAKWCSEGYFPTLEEYLETAFITTCYPLMAMITYLCMGQIANKDVFEWGSNSPKIFEASQAICRLMDDIVTHKIEHEREHIPSSIECCMDQHGVSEQEAIEQFQTKISNAWKDTNQEFLKPTAVPATILVRVLNLSRIMDVYYKDCDGFTNSHAIKDYLESVVAKPFPL